MKSLILVFSFFLFAVFGFANCLLAQNDARTFYFNKSKYFEVEEEIEILDDDGNIVGHTLQVMGYLGCTTNGVDATVSDFKITPSPQQAIDIKELTTDLVENTLGEDEKICVVKYTIPIGTPHYKFPKVDWKSN
jgi:hypothetical protein